MKPLLTHLWTLAGISVIATGCADKNVDPAKPTAAAEHKSLSERLSEGGGYKQDEQGNWVPKSDKRSSFDSQRDSPYFKGKIDKEEYKTGEVAKKSWWGNKNYQTAEYAGNTDASRFQTTARQQGQVAEASGKKSSLTRSYETNTLDNSRARESNAAQVSRTSNSAVEARRKVFKAPSVIDWQQQREMSLEQSRGILGR
ncbi:hypothetical protein ACFSSA_10980 [Luteolibacter algae]|uniref:Lipoprotein n=1 Tax=Luteolibacter algae TaxID=454151 RepID=A0ABW5DCS7_9BACT